MENFEKESSENGKLASIEGWSGLETEIVLRGIVGSSLDVKIPELRVDGYPTNFVGGLGTRNDPCEQGAYPGVPAVAIENTRHILEWLQEGDKIKRTIYFKHFDNLIGVDGQRNISLVRRKEDTDENIDWFKKNVIEPAIKEIKETQKKNGSNPADWQLQVIE